MNEEVSISNVTCHYVELGKIGRPHGVRGDVRLFLHNPDSELIYTLKSVLLSPSEDVQPKSYKVRRIKDGGKSHILDLAEVHNIEQAKRLTGLLFFVPRDALPELGEGEYYINDLIGIEVIHENAPIGKIVSTREQGGIEVVTVASEEQEIQIPLVDNFVEMIDVPQKQLSVRNIEGLPVHVFSSKG